MTRKPVLLALALTCLAVAACKREAAAPPAAADTAPTEAVKSAVISEIDHNSPASAAPGFDAKAFAGTYGGTLPCADCPGIDTSVAFTAEGTYTMSEVYQDGAGSSFVTKGTWTVGEDGKSLLLDPESKDDRDRRLQIASATELRADGEGAADTGAGYTLRRR